MTVENVRPWFKEIARGRPSMRAYSSSSTARTEKRFGLSRAIGYLLDDEDRPGMRLWFSRIKR